MFFFTSQRCFQKTGLQVFSWVDVFVFVYKLCAVDSISGEACNWNLFFCCLYLPLAHNRSNSHYLDFSFFLFKKKKNCSSTDYKVFHKYLQIIVVPHGNGAGIVSSTFQVRKPLNLFHFFQWCCIETLFIIVDLHRECFFMPCCKDIFKHRYDFVVSHKHKEEQLVNNSACTYCRPTLFPCFTKWSFSFHLVDLLVWFSWASCVSYSK